jgi:hypothetical protein
VVEDNDGQGSPVAILVENRGDSNAEGLELRGNAGTVVMEAEPPRGGGAESAAAPGGGTAAAP